MSVQFTIIGLGQLGASMGLALAKIKDQVVRVGNDRETSVMRQAERIGAFDKTMVNLPSAVKDADVVILALPVDEVRETMEIIAQDLKPGCVLMDISPNKETVMLWAKEILPGEDRYFVGLTPGLNPAYLHETGSGIDNAHADLFKNGLILVNTLPGIDDSAITLTTNLVQILGATAVFTDPAEADGLLAYSHLLPQLVAAALVNASIDQPGWREARKLAGQIFAQTSESALYPSESKALGQAALLNAANTTRMIDQVITELHNMRDALQEQDAAAVQAQLQHARDGRLQWWSERLAGKWEITDKPGVRIPTSGESIGRLFGFRPKKDRDSK